MPSDSALLRDLVLTSRDGEWGRETPADDYASARVIRGADFPSARIGDLSAVPTRYIHEQPRARKTLRPGDIVIETAGGGRDRPTGRTLLVTRQLVDASDLPIICASFSRFLRVDPAKAEPRYVFWYLQYLYETGAMWEHQVQHTGLARFQYTRFAETVAVPLPPKNEQRRIADVLCAIDDKIELNHSMNQTLEAMAGAVFRSWFVDFDPVVAKAEGRQPFGMDAQTAALFPSRFVESEVGPIPDGWSVASISDIATNPRRIVEPRSMDPRTPYIGLEHMPRRCIVLSEWGRVGDVSSAKTAFAKGEILFGKLRPYFHKVGVALCDGVCSTDVVVVVPKEQSEFGFVLGHLSSVEFVDYTDAGSGGTRMPRTRWVDMARCRIALAPRAVSERFNSFMRPIVEQFETSSAESRTLAELRDALLPKLLSGEIRVREAEKEVEAAL